MNLGVLLRRELALAWGRGGGPLLACAFYACLTTLLPLAAGPEPERLAVIVLPLFAPPVIFGGGAIVAYSEGLNWTSGLLLLTGYSLAAVGLSPFAMAAACRNALS